MIYVSIKKGYNGQQMKSKNEIFSNDKLSPKENSFQLHEIYKQPIESVNLSSHPTLPLQRQTFISSHFNEFDSSPLIEDSHIPISVNKGKNYKSTYQSNKSISYENSLNQTIKLKSNDLAISAITTQTKNVASKEDSVDHKNENEKEKKAKHLSVWNKFFENAMLAKEKKQMKLSNDNFKINEENEETIYIPKLNKIANGMLNYQCIFLTYIFIMSKFKYFHYSQCIQANGLFLHQT